MTARLMTPSLLLVALAAGAVGCGREACTLTGRVTYLGKPVTGGSIVLYCDGRQIVRGLIEPDGAYTISNVPWGSVRVTVMPPVRLPEGFRKQYRTPPVANGPITPEIGRPAADGRTAAIPARYGVPEESGLTVAVEQSVTVFDIHLTR